MAITGSVAAPHPGRPLRLLVTNDDGPPGHESPFISEFIRTLASSPHYQVFVCLPSCQKSWISKAHVITETLQVSLYDPVQGLTKEFTEKHIEDATMDPKHWYYVSGTPAACVNIALHHLHTKVPFDAVISGPNVGMNSGTTYSLSSGTIGAALEASLNGLPAIAISYGYTNSSDVRAENLVTLAHIKAMRVIDHLLHGEVWSEGTLYNVNIPLVETTELCMHQTTFHPSSSARLYAHQGQGKFHWQADWEALMHRQDVKETTDVAVTKRGDVSITVLRPSYEVARDVTLNLPSTENLMKE